MHWLDALADETLQLKDRGPFQCSSVDKTCISLPQVDCLCACSDVDMCLDDVTPST